jgi:hypothetical protein
MRPTIAVVAAALVTLVGAGAANAGDIHDAQGLVFRQYAGVGYRFQPLLSFAALNRAVTRRDTVSARRLSAALLARGAHRGRSLYWRYDFSFDGGPPTWTSGFTQAVAARALARASVLLHDGPLAADARAAFRGLGTLLIPVEGGDWVREYSFTGQVILNAQLESALTVASYAAITEDPAAARLARSLEHAARTMLPRFDLGCWGRYQLGGVAADAHYEAYHVDLLGRMAAAHPREPVWRSTYRRWKQCLHA